ncbi:alpha/beta fold hydrolase [Sphingomonas solaris]|uniref:Alpha/beta hydrolase n=1 Tax=Alterirhizorhabdus solaris TaxID=2529389 RepID=A0A558RBH0_9SPHN|nr:alpha/beta hydrolase [Sphingomonas solaris]TVV76749.1 alpha/beta hydrolase [Sphingomonas solaris]
MQRIEFRGAGVTIVGDADGPAGGVPLIFLHGGGQTRQSWGRAIAEAARRGYHAITIDLRGHGESGWSPDGRYGIDRFAEDTRCIIETLGRPPVLVGASLGGFTALLVAAEPPPAIAGLVLVDIAPRIESEGTGEIGAFMKSAPNGFASLDEAADAVSAYLPHRKRPKDTSGLMRNLRLRDDGRLHWHWDPAFIRPQPDEPPRDPARFEAAARNIHVPTLLLRGGKSRVVSEAGARAFLDLVPGAEWVDVAGADHMVAGDANDSFNTAVFDFLARHAPADPAGTGEPGS